MQVRHRRRSREDIVSVVVPGRLNFEFFFLEYCRIYDRWQTHVDDTITIPNLEA